MSEQMTPDESAAFEAMAQDTAPVTDAEMAENPAEVTAEPAPAAEPEPAKAEEKPPEGFVPHGALHSEREKRKALEKQFAELQAQVESLKAPKEPEPEMQVPDPILDPDGFKRWAVDQAKQQQQQFQQFETKRPEEARMQQMVQAAAKAEQDFAAKTPDYMNAVNYMAENRKAELAAYGYSPEQAEAILANDANTIVSNALASGRNPAEVLYQAARLRGYGLATPAQPQQAPADRMKALSAAQANTASLAAASGPSNEGGYKVEMLARMSEAELAKLPKDVFAKVMGSA